MEDFNSRNLEREKAGLKPLDIFNAKRQFELIGLMKIKHAELINSSAVFCISQATYRSRSPARWEAFADR